MRASRSSLQAQSQLSGADGEIRSHAQRVAQRRNAQRGNPIQIPGPAIVAGFDELVAELVAHPVDRAFEPAPQFERWHSPARVVPHSHRISSQDTWAVGIVTTSLAVRSGDRAASIRRNAASAWPTTWSIL